MLALYVLLVLIQLSKLEFLWELVFMLEGMSESVKTRADARGRCP